MPDADVGLQGELESRAGRHTVQCSDAGLLQLAQRVVEAPPRLEPLETFRAAFDLLRLVEVLTGRERAVAHPRKDDGAYVCTPVPALEMHADF